MSGRKIQRHFPSRYSAKRQLWAKRRLRKRGKSGKKRNGAE